MSIAEDCAIMRQVQEAARRRSLTRIDRELKRGPYADLYRCGLAVQAEIKTERPAEAGLDIEILEATAWPHAHAGRSELNLADQRMRAAIAPPARAAGWPLSGPCACRRSATSHVSASTWTGR